MTDTTKTSDRIFAAFAAFATTFTMLIVSFTPTASSVSGVIA